MITLACTTCGDKGTARSGELPMGWVRTTPPGGGAVRVECLTCANDPGDVDDRLWGKGSLRSPTARLAEPTYEALRDHGPITARDLAAILHCQTEAARARVRRLIDRKRARVVRLESPQTFDIRRP